MSHTLLFTLLASIVAHAAVLLYEGSKATEQTLNMGSIKAPVILTFSSSGVPTQSSTVETLLNLSEKNTYPVVKKKVKIKSDIVKIAKPKPVESEVKKQPESPQQVVEKTPQKREEPRTEQQTPQVARSALEESKTEGVSDKPVFIENPTILNATTPQYPPIAQRRNMQGVVMLEVIVDTDGNAMNIIIIESSGHEVLDKSAIAAVKRWKFGPQKRNNHVVASKVHIPVAFQLN